MAPFDNDLDDGWRDLLLTVDGKPRERSARNAAIFFEHHPEVAPSLGFNAFTNQVVAVAALPWDNRGLKYPRALSHEDAIRSLGWLECQGLFKLSIGTAWDALTSAARRRPFNPLVDWLHSIQWDGTPRLSNWLSYYLGVESSPYVSSISAKFLISAVSRAFKPGCKVDTMPILEGPQGIKKSTALRVLFGPDYYSDELADFGSKDAAMQMQGKNCIEVAELSTFSRADVRRVKEVLSRQVDRYRAPYDRVVAEHPRQCIFVGTTNPVDGYFKDPTGGRRFWPVVCGTIDIDALAHDREQLWAEAVYRFEAGEQWWLSASEIPGAQAEQSKRQESDPWDEEVEEFINGRFEVTAREILKDAIKIDIGKRAGSEQMRVTAILTRLGWVKKDERRGHRVLKVWRPKSPDVATFDDDFNEVATPGSNAQTVDIH